MLLGKRLVQAARARVPPEFPLFGLALLVAVAARLLLLALVDATAFPAISVGYLSPAFALLVAFVALVLAGGGPHGERTSTQ